MRSPIRKGDKRERGDEVTGRRSPWTIFTARRLARKADSVSDEIPDGRKFAFSVAAIILSCVFPVVAAHQNVVENKSPKLPESKILFRDIWGQDWPSYVQAEPVSRPSAFKLQERDRYLISIPVKISADSAYRIGYTSGTLHWISPVDAMLVAVVSLPGGEWPTNGKPVVAAYSSSAIPRNCELAGLPGDGSEDGPLPNDVKEIFLPNGDAPNQSPLHFFNVETTWFEGYAGGGGTFSVQQMLEWSSDYRYNHEIFWRACAPRSYNKLLARNWNSDGTRDHHEYSGSWTWRFVRQKENSQWKLELFEDGRGKEAAASWSADWQDLGPFTIDYYNVRTPTDF